MCVFMYMYVCIYVCMHVCVCVTSHLAPHQHGSKDDLQAIEEVVPDDDDGGSSCSPALTGADGLDTRSRWGEKRWRGLGSGWREGGRDSNVRSQFVILWVGIHV